MGDTMNELKNKKILVVDDEKELLNMIQDILWSNGFYNVYTAESCRDAIEIVKAQPIALCVLDINLPDGNGFSLFNDLRRLTNAPVIFLTARGEANDKLNGLSLGADDYIVKPFLTQELLLRITALLRRTYTKPHEISSFNLSDRTVDFETATVTHNGKNILLTPKEFVILKKLWENKNRIVINDVLCMTAWGDGYYGFENTLMVHIRRLREKIEATPSSPKHLITVKGIGYKLVINNE